MHLHMTSRLMREIGIGALASVSLVLGLTNPAAAAKVPVVDVSGHISCAHPARTKLVFTKTIVGAMKEPQVTCIPLNGSFSQASMTVIGDVGGNPEELFIGGYDGTSGVANVVAGAPGVAPGELTPPTYEVDGIYPANPPGIVSINFAKSATIDVRLKEPV